MKCLLLCSLLLIFVAALSGQGLNGLAGALSGAEADEVAVKIPFSFLAAGERLPAGDYVIQKDLRWNLLRVCENGARCAVVQAANTKPLDAKGKPRLLFAEQAGNYVLTLVQANRGRGYRLPGYSKTAEDVIELTGHSSR